MVAWVNRADLDALGPKPGFVRLFMGVRAPRNPGMGIDVAGVVDAVGPDARRFHPGDRVFADIFSFAQQYGAFAEYVVASEKAFLPIPDRIDFETAATLPHSAVLAVQGLRRRDGRTFEPGREGPHRWGVGQRRPVRRPDRQVDGAPRSRASPAATSSSSCGRSAPITSSTIATVDYTKGRERYDWIVAADSHHSIRAARRALAPGRDVRHAGRDVDDHHRRDAHRPARVGAQRPLVRADAVVEAVPRAGRPDASSS